MNFMNLGILSWNVRDLGDVKKCNQIKEIISSSNSTIICLQETKWDMGDLFKLRTICPQDFNQAIFLHSNHNAGGFLIIWTDTYTATTKHITTYTNSMVLSLATGFSFLLTNIYGPTYNNLKLVSESYGRFQLTKNKY